MTARALLALVLICAAASAARAKGLCIQVDSGFYAGSAIVLRGVSLRGGKFAPVNGYFFEYNPGPGSHRFYPVHGQAIMSSAGALAVGLLHHPTSVTPDGYGNGSGPAGQITLSCLAGLDGRISVLDYCTGYVLDTIPNLHVIDCKDVAPLP